MDELIKNKILNSQMLTEDEVEYIVWEWEEEELFEMVNTIVGGHHIP